MSTLQACCSSSCRQNVAAAPMRPTATRRYYANSRTSFSGQQVGVRRQQQQLWTLATAAAAPQWRQRRWGGAVVAAASSSAPVSLETLEFHPVLNVQGYISPTIPDGTEATVFAIYDSARIVQYIGFSKGLRDTLRTLFSRRPDKAHYYKALHLPQLDQQQMIDTRAAWFDANSGPPSGNKLPTERDQWQQPVDAFSISERGKVQAAVELAKQLQQRIKQRGCCEEFVPDADLLELGKVDFLPAAALSEEELERQRQRAAEAAKSTRVIAFEVDGQPETFDLYFKNVMKTNGGHMFDVTITFQDKETQHRVVVGRDYYEPQGIEPQVTVERVFMFLLKKKVPRHTEGMLLNTQFSSNYFSISQVEQTFDDFADEFAELGVLPGCDFFWRFNRTKDYGLKGKNETAEQLRATFG